MAWRRILDRADYGVGIELLVEDQLCYGEANLFHVLGKVNCELLPSGKGFPTETAWLFCWPFCRLRMALFNLCPRAVDAASFFDGSFGLDLRLRVLVLADKMLQKIIPPVADVAAAIHVTLPPFEMAVALVFVADPVGLSLEHLWVTASVPRAGEWLYIFVHVLGPIRGFLEFLMDEA